MSLRVCLLANTLDYPEGGGHLWVSLNWALGLRALGCEVHWLELERGLAGVAPLPARVETLKSRLARYGLADSLAVCFPDDVEPAAPSAATGQGAAGDARSYLPLDAVTDADLLLNLQYFAPAAVVGRFRRAALLDIDPGLLQLWVSEGLIPLAPHDVHFTIGETVGRVDARFPDAGIRWLYTPPCVALDWWPAVAPTPDAPFTTVTHWWAGEWLEEGGEVYDNTKRAGFLPFVDLPSQTRQPLELALFLSPSCGSERAMLTARGWRIRDSSEVASTPWEYQHYLQGSRGEFSCAKPSCLRLQNAWISDRTLCYLASGRPAVVQHTGPSGFLPDAEGLFRFRDVPGAAEALERAAADPERQGALARSLAEEYFDARTVVARLLERALS